MTEEGMKKEKTEITYDNEMMLTFDAIACNEALARMTVMAFLTPLNPTMEEIADVKTAISEAVTNSIVHAYNGGKTEGKIWIECRAEENATGGVLHITIKDDGCGIADVEKALQPFFTTLENEERSGMGFTIMQSFMDGFSLCSDKGKGTKVTMFRNIVGNTPIRQTAKEGMDA